MVRWGGLLLATVVCSSLGAARHPLHTTITEISYFASTRAARITLRAFEDDVVAAAARPDDAGIISYVARHVVLSDRGGKPTTITWEALRKKDGLLVIAGRAQLTDGLRGVRVLNHMMTERYDDQVNVVQASDGSRRQTVLFTRGDGPKPLR